MIVSSTNPKVQDPITTYKIKSQIKKNKSRSK